MNDHDPELEAIQIVLEFKSTINGYEHVDQALCPCDELSVGNGTPAHFG